MIRPVFFLLTATLLSACLFMGETAAVISAQVVDQDERAYSHCSIDLLVNKDSDLHRQRHMKRQISFDGTTFEQLFIIGPKQIFYVAEITCMGARDTYLSKPVQLGAGINQPVNLGRIILIRNISD